MDQSNFADQFVSGLLSWVRWIGEKIVGTFQAQGSTGSSSGGNALFSWFSNNWIGLLVVLVVLGIVLDWIVWMVRWRPYWLWFGKRRVLYDDDIDIDLTDEELERRFGPLEPMIDGREHFRASQLGRAGRPMYGDDEDIGRAVPRVPARRAARDDEDGYGDYDDDDGYDDDGDDDDGPDIEDPYDGRAEIAYRQQAEARRAKYQPREPEAVNEDDVFDELYDDGDEFDDGPEGDDDDYDDDDYDDDDYDDDGDDGGDGDDSDYDDDFEVDFDGEPDDDSDEDIAPAKPMRGLFARKPKPAQAEAGRARPARDTSFVSASRGGRRTGSDLIPSPHPMRGGRASVNADPADDPFSVDGLVGDEDDGFMEVVSSMAESPLPPVGRLPKNMPHPGRDAEIASEFAPDPERLGDWRTGYSGVHDAVRAPNVGEQESALQQMEVSSRRARRRARNQESISAEGVGNSPAEGAFEDE